MAFTCRETARHLVRLENDVTVLTAASRGLSRPSREKGVVVRRVSALHGAHGVSSSWHFIPYSWCRRPS